MLWQPALLAATQAKTVSAVAVTAALVASRFSPLLAATSANV